MLFTAASGKLHDGMTQITTVRPRPCTSSHAAVFPTLTNAGPLFRSLARAPRCLYNNFVDRLSPRVGGDAIGWRIDVLDIAGELTPYARPEPPDGGSKWAASPADYANKWHRVIVVGRPRPPGGTQQGAGGVVGEGLEEKEQEEQEEEEEEGGGEDKDTAARAKEMVRSLRDSSSSVFVIKFDSGKRASLDLSHFSIKWVSFCSDCKEIWANENSSAPGGGVGSCGGGGGGGGRVSDDRRGVGTAQNQATAVPPGFGRVDSGGLPPVGGLANDPTDVGTRVDVWWPRDNLYFRATVRRLGRLGARFTGVRWGWGFDRVRLVCGEGRLSTCLFCRSDFVVIAPQRACFVYFCAVCTTRARGMRFFNVRVY